MTEINVRGLEGSSLEELKKVESAISEVVSSFGGIQSRVEEEKRVMVFFLPDLIGISGGNVSIKISALPYKPNISKEMLDKLTHLVGEKVSKFFPDTHISCRARMPAVQDGVWNSKAM